MISVLNPEFKIFQKKYNFLISNYYKINTELLSKQIGEYFEELEDLDSIETKFYSTLIINSFSGKLSPKETVKLFQKIISLSFDKLILVITNPLIGQLLNSYLTASQLHNKSEVVESLGMIDVDINPENTGIYYFNGEILTELNIYEYGATFSSFKETQDIIYSVNRYLGELMFKQQSKKN